MSILALTKMYKMYVVFTFVYYMQHGKNRSVFSIMDIVEYITSKNEIKKSTTLTEHFQNPIEKS